MVETTLYTKCDGYLLVIGTGDFTYPLQRHMTLSLIDVDPMTHLHVELGEYCIKRIVPAFSGFRTGPKAIWHASAPGACTITAYVVPLDAEARAYVQFCRERQTEHLTVP